MMPEKHDRYSGFVPRGGSGRPLLARFDVRSAKRKIQYCLCITIDIPLQVKVRLVANKTQRGFFNFHLTPHTQMQFISGSNSYRVGQKSINKALLGL